MSDTDAHGPDPRSGRSPRSDGFWDEIDAIRQEIDGLEQHKREVEEQIRLFEERYRHTIANRNAELEQLRADVAAARSERDLEAERRARDAAEVAARLTPKERHRSMVKRIHPDLASDEDDRAHRETLMKRINDALDRNDMGEFDWLETEVDLYARDTIAQADQELLRDRLRERLIDRVSKIHSEISSVQAQQLWALYEEANAAAAEGRDLLEELATDIDAQIRALRQELNMLRNG